MVKDISKTTTHVPKMGEQERWLDPRGVEYVSNDMPYLTTGQLAKELDNQYPETVFRWCRKWFGNLPPGRRGAGLGYRIPLEYKRVGRAWLMTEDTHLREVVRRAIVDSPKDWVVVVANVGSTHYSVAEAVGRAESIAHSSTYRNHVISILYVGDNPTEG